MKKFILGALALAGSASMADVRMTTIFANNMILQQKTSNAVWGFADAGEEVQVKASWGSSASTTANSEGKWKVMLPTPGHGTGFGLTIKGKNQIDIKNVAIGEVWLCAGQSNMGWALGMTFGGEEEAEAVDLPNFRIYKSAREHWHEPLDEARDKMATWKSCKKDSALETSAVSYYFGKKLHQELGIPVGIVVQAFAGTPIEGWMPKEIQMNDQRTVAGMKQMDEMSEKLKKKGISAEKSLAQHAKELATYNKRVAAGDIMKNKTKKIAPPIITKPSNLGHQYPSHIFNVMINPIRPYGIKGAIWYQGERNSKDAAQAINYRKQLALMIDFYRKSWNEMSEGNTDRYFPFQFTQLPSWNPAQSKAVEGPEAVWSINREMMRLVTQDIKNAYMSVAIDTGDAIQLHPKNKKPIGIRHAYLALKNTYGKDFVDYGPKYKSHEVKGNRIVISFDSIGSGMMAAKAGKLNAFAIAGEDQKWHWADAEIQGDKIVLSSAKVAKPVAVRYAWAMNPSERNLLYNKEGLPASPFRTDQWDLYDSSAEIITVHKPAKAATKATEDWKRPVMTQ
ncbi:sialic acid-specific 9-O-acetylesterase [Lentisphaera araneosa HTCC2155]|uniref:Sialic acid-specific 9-O-acetylesterase n=1 Tax=Lentisphaera araneosa HTCC2155 TaxID=313628 RepID=A6DS84_9BACT|nr:sialic acid-specific 9-O-acetylesterase [Lentisphaera araneosa]EDM25544.1 sialic acid-specific 9-O-acetylesterase [Lentisphaera araneosa HTCC2155]